ncbi:hypothetical protein BH11MYX2_BH11MYX2_39400 [soil metagenome]
MVCAVLFAGACAAASEQDEDAEAEAASSQDLGVTITGVFQSHATTHYDGDIPSLELTTEHRYVRTRCYHASCAIKAPETDAFDSYTSASGKIYVRFKTVKVTFVPDVGVVQTPQVADVYEIKTFALGIKLRKAYSSRWQVLYTSSPSLQCTSTSGTWAADACTCPGNDPSAPSVTLFASGAGGCYAAPDPYESDCDDTGGFWTDDDATALGTYCVCGAGRYISATAGCVGI